MADWGGGRQDASRQAALYAPLIAATCVIPLLGTYGLTLLIRGRADALTALSYNGPIAYVFLTLVFDLALRAWRLGLPEFLRAHRTTLTLWALGVAVLYLRLVSKSIDVSGHITWLPLLTVQAWLHGLPRWFLVFSLLSTAVAFYLKLFEFRGPSGIPGAVVGSVLALALLSASRTKRFGASCGSSTPVPDLRAKLP